MASSQDASSHKSHTEEESTGKNTHVRFLVSNAEAGVIIGKGGSVIHDIQFQSGARVHLSRNHELFPGTNDRIVTVSGAIYDTLKAVDLVLTKLLDEFCIKEGNDAEQISSLKVVVPSSSCGGIIGKGACTLRSFKEESQADIVVSPQDDSYHGPDNRLVIIDGTLDEQMVAIDLILSKLTDDPQYAQAFRVPFPSAGNNRQNFVSKGPAQKFQSKKEDSPSQVDKNSLTIGVLDEHIGFVVGRGGRNLKEITQATGARIKISNRGDFIPGTYERKVTIIGSEIAIREAEDMIMDKVTFAESLAA